MGREKLGEPISGCRAKGLHFASAGHSERHGFPTTTAFETLQVGMPCNYRQAPNEAHRLTAFGTSGEKFEHDPK